MTLSTLALAAALTLGGWGHSRPTTSATEVAVAPIQDDGAIQRLLSELTREPRIIGTPGYDRALATVKNTLIRAGLKPSERTRKSGRAIATRCDVLFFEDATQSTAFGGLRERWDPAAIPTMPRPMAYDHNPASAGVRGPVVHIGAGLDADFERVREYGADLSGAVLLAVMELAPAKRSTTVREIAERAAGAGAAGLLIAPLPDMDLAPLEARQLYVRENTIHKNPLPLPVAPIRGLEAEAIGKRLRTKRIRGEDGKAIPVRLGPGPVEVSVTVECPLVVIEDVLELVLISGAGSPAGSPAGPNTTSEPMRAQPAASRRVSLNGLPDRPLDGAFELTAEVLCLTRRYGAEASALREAVDGTAPTTTGIEVTFGPFALSKSHALLGPHTLVSSVDETPVTGRTTLIPGLFTRPAQVNALLGKELSTRMDAASRFIAYDSELQTYATQASRAAASWDQLSRIAEDAARLLRRLH